MIPVNETIRQRFRRRMRVAALFCVSGLLLTVLSVRYVPAPRTGPLLPQVLPVIGMMIFMVGLLISGTGRCPRCLNVVNPFISLYKRCPTCGIGLDEPCR